MRGEVLAREDLGRRHQRRLAAGLDRVQHGQQGDHRLAAADIALQQPQHPRCGGHVGVDFRQCLCCAPVSAKGRAAMHPLAQPSVAGDAPSRARGVAGRGPAPAPADWRAARHRRGGGARGAAGDRSSSPRGVCSRLQRGAPAAASLSRASNAGSMPLRQARARSPSAARIALPERPSASGRRSAGRPARPAVSASAWARGDDMVGVRHLRHAAEIGRRRPLDDPRLADRQQALQLVRLDMEIDQRR